MATGLLANAVGCSQTYDYTGDSAETDSSAEADSAEEDSSGAGAARDAGSQPVSESQPNERPVDSADRSRPRFDSSPPVSSATPNSVDDPMAIEPAPGEPLQPSPRSVSSPSPKPVSSKDPASGQSKKDQGDAAGQTPNAAAAETPPPPPKSSGGGLEQLFSDILGEEDPEPAAPPSEVVETRRPAAVVVKPREAISAKDLFGGGPAAPATDASAPSGEPEPKPQPPAGQAASTEPESPPSEPSVFEPPVDIPAPTLPSTPERAAEAPTRPEPERLVPKRPELPPTRIDVDNTRHLAWLLGSKTSLVSLSHLMDAPVEEDENGWQLRALAELLGVTPPDNRASAAAPGEAIGELLAETRRLAAEMAPKLGDDHAALMEVAVKTNLLLMLYEKKPSLAGPIRRAVTAAAPRAGIADATWRPLVDLLAGSPTSEEVRGEVFRLHGAVERELLGNSP